MNIKTHHFFQVHFPTKNYDGSSEDELAEIIMEEFHLYNNGESTKNYETVNPKSDALAINLYPSFIYLANKIKKDEREKSQFINDCIDDEFVNFLTRFNPVYKLMDFIEYHYLLFDGDKNAFVQHIKYSIISLIERRKKFENGKDFDKYEEIEKLVLDWIESKTKVKDETTKITNPKDLYKLIAIIISIVGLIITVLINWEKISKIFIK